MKIRYFLSLCLVIFFSSQCADVMKLVKQGNIKNPDVKVKNARLTGLDLEKINIVFDIEIFNPNPVSVTLAGFDYDLLLNKTSFLTGEQQKKLELKASDDVGLSLPISMNFEKVYKTYQTIKDQENVVYILKTGFSFNLPVLGKVRIPVSTSGEFPMVKVPVIGLKSIRLKKLSFSGADFEVQVNIDNPNSWPLTVNEIQYEMSINGKQWINGRTTERLTLSAKGKNNLLIPFSLNFIEMGSSVYNVVTEGKGLNYKLTGQANIGSTLEMLGELNLPFNLSGNLDLLK